MTQSKDDNNSAYDEYVTLNLDDILDTTSDITINLDNTYGTTTTYWAGDSVTDITISGANDDSFTIESGTIDTEWVRMIWGGSIDTDEVERMCKHYPALEKVWRNFKGVYDMCKQDYEGKKKAGEIDDDYPF